ncbi:MAG: hypothetical protein KJ872_07060 [Alphaproteobacteria bacterium]|nr:hypothetical protein [Alphaproteobacteria bacterium]
MRAHDHLQTVLCAFLRAAPDKCDKLLTYPPVSTGDPGKSGKLGLADVARSPVEAHFQLVFGTRINWNRPPQGLEVLMI